MQYSPGKSIEKSLAVGLVPVIIGEVLPLVVPSVDRATAYMIGTAVSAAVAGVRNWWKNRRKR